MQYLLFPMIDEGSWQAMSEPEQRQGMAAYGAFGTALRQAGVLVGNYRPELSANARTVRVSDGQRQVSEGPYAATKEQLGGVSIVNVPDLDAALAWAERCPASAYGVVEVRPIWGPPAAYGSNGSK